VVEEVLFAGIAGIFGGVLSATVGILIGNIIYEKINRMIIAKL
jgi:hypothetical protein